MGRRGREEEEERGEGRWYYLVGELDWVWLGVLWLLVSGGWSGICLFAVSDGIRLGIRRCRRTVLSSSGVVWGRFYVSRPSGVESSL